ncbi:hypothetical protein ASPWEDRAFT_49153 [Aspergillus wentii DTO 134E9]|uniref:Extracellular thaumatin domain protein n=1 Tax=Aspergillus wentii DTO 134E9 TaxID=1073089 RepID=A0A1L9RW52_ASPWE|nr:uncharacterized protein ASPWEDRAFT_49153 [Aspergillus wentii DTO 134E9]KAI9929209.1 hypothetical protein MW887_001617 [Aspergillus wentii]OJJ39087.1 hypothetical protein ASPWEDRAFT_49153 [Aspergillus wentii DTO 134E9]
MLFSKIFSMAAAFAVASALPHTVSRRGGSGGVTIVNNLNQDVYAWTVSNRAGNMQTLSAGGGSMQQDWKTNSNGGGISIKLSTSPSQEKVLQYEYTQSGDTIFWDMSCIDMGSDSEFTKYGFTVEPSQTSANCPAVNCKAGDSACAEAYLKPDDNHATHGCPIDTTFKLMIGNGN